MIGAIVSRFVLGIEVQNDGGTLYAGINYLSFCSILVYQNRNKMTDLLKLKI
jgi:hypothetical protein